MQELIMNNIARFNVADHYSLVLLYVCIAIYMALNLADTLMTGARIKGNIVLAMTTLVCFTLGYIVVTFFDNGEVLSIYTALKLTIGFVSLNEIYESMAIYRRLGGKLPKFINDIIESRIKEYDI